jgi:hypothetical protein
MPETGLPINLTQSIYNCISNNWILYSGKNGSESYLRDHCVKLTAGCKGLQVINEFREIGPYQLHAINLIFLTGDE